MAAEKASDTCSAEVLNEDHSECDSWLKDRMMEMKSNLESA